MIIVPVKDGENIERALKKFKRKFEKTGDCVPDSVWLSVMGDSCRELKSGEEKQCDVCGTGTGILLWRTCNSGG